MTALEKVVDELARVNASTTSAGMSRDSSFYNATFAPELADLRDSANTSSMDSSFASALEVLAASFAVAVRTNSFPLLPVHVTNL